MDFPHVVVARLYEHIEPIDRGERYEDPLQAALDETNAGRVTGGIVSAAHRSHDSLAASLGLPDAQRRL